MELLEWILENSDLYFYDQLFSCLVYWLQQVVSPCLSIVCLFVW